MGLSTGSSAFQMGAVLFFALFVLSSASSEEFEYRKKDLPPVILVPGLGGSDLNARFINQPKNCPDKKSWFFLYMDDYMFWMNFDCILTSLSMVYDNQTGLSHNNPDVEIEPVGWGKLEGINSIAKSGAVPYMQHLGDILKKMGYEEGISIFGAPYDFRYGPHQQETLFTKLTDLIEKTVENRKSPAVLVAHSMGAPLVSILLNRKSEEWRKKYVDSLVTLSGAWGGAVSSLEGLAIGPDSYTYFRPQVRLEQSVIYMLPDLDLWNNNETIVDIADKSYSMNDIEYLLKRMNLPDNADMYRKQERFHRKSKFAPQVPLHCLYGDQVETLETLQYKSPNDYPDNPHNTKTGNGDGTVNHKSLDLCSQFTKYQSEPVYVKSFKSISHLDIIKASEPVQYLVHHVLEIANKKKNNLGAIELGEEGKLKISSEEIVDTIVETNKILEAIREQKEADWEVMRKVYEGMKKKSDEDPHLEMRQKIVDQFLKKFKGRTTSIDQLPSKMLNRL